MFGLSAYFSQVGIVIDVLSGYDKSIEGQIMRFDTVLKLSSGKNEPVISKENINKITTEMKESSNPLNR